MSLLAQAVALRAAVASVDVGALSGEACGRLAAELARTENACAALRSMAAARAAACGTHRHAGFRSPEDWLARLTGTTRQRARSELATGELLPACPETRSAATAGDLSLGQAEDIARTEVEK